LQSTLQQISLKERDEYTEKAKATCRVVCTTIAPNDGENLFKLVQQPEEERISEESLSLLMAYKNAPTKNIKTQILRIYAYNYSIERLKELHESFEKLSSRQIKKAREHSKKVGSGIPLQKKVSHRVRIHMVKLEHFLGFIDRPYFYQDVAFGTRKKVEKSLLCQT
jgi:bisphosphoglycerate-independent phosphoglycerate mutase (AlkP superfamily)